MASSCFPATGSSVAAIGGCNRQKLNLITNGFHYSPATRFLRLNCKAANNDRNTKPNSVICGDCDGNVHPIVQRRDTVDEDLGFGGVVLCSQCKGHGVNAVDFFNGQFKAGASCWLCGGKKEMLCGNCNGAGFVGGFLSTYDQ